MPLRPGARRALPRTNDIGYMLPIGRGKAESDAQVRNLGMWVMATVESCDRFAVNVASAGSHENSLLELGFEYSLQCNKKCRSVVAVPVGVTAWSNFGVIYLHLDLRIPGYRRDKSVEKDIPVQLLSRSGVACKSKSEVVQRVIRNHSFVPLNAWTEFW